MLRDNLLRQVKIGPYTLQNPLVFGPHRLNFPEGHLPGPRRIAYYAERAKHGVGMIIVEGSQAWPGEYPHDWALNVYEPGGAVKAYNRLAETVHRYPTVLVGQLNLYGGQGDSSVTRRPLIAPSPVPEVNSNEVPKVLTIEEIRKVVKGFEHGAIVLDKAGFDGVEINAGQFSLLRQFLSCLTNFRDDIYGGTVLNRCRLLEEVLQKVRSVLGPEKLLGLRLCADEYAPWAGIQPEEAHAMALYLAEQVKLDYIALENGSIYSVNMTMAGYNQPEDYALAAARVVAQDVTTPVCVGGSLVSPAVVDQALNEFTLADITRALIADPTWIEKVKSAQEPTIVPCILCKQGCHTHSNTNPPIACSVNPQAGVEYPGRPERPYRIAKRLAIAGGGPGGLAAALTALRLGHQVVLYEAKAELGGQWRLFAENFAAPGPKKLLQYYQQNLATYEKSGQLQILLNTPLDVATAKTYQGVLVATGANYQAADFPGSAAKLSVAQALAAPLPVGKRALVWDALGDQRALVLCRRLAATGYQVVLATKDSYLANKLVKLGEFNDWYGEMARLGIIEKTSCKVHYAGQDKLELQNIYNDEIEILEGVDVVVAAMAPLPETTLWQALQHQGVPCICLGDAVAPRTLMAAVREGALAAQEL